MIKEKNIKREKNGNEDAKDEIIVSSRFFFALSLAIS